VAAVFDAREDFAHGRPIARELIGDHDPRHVGEALQLLAQKLRGCSLIAPRLHEDVEHVPVLVDRPPEVLLCAIDLDEDLVQMASSQGTFSA